MLSIWLMLNIKHVPGYQKYKCKNGGVMEAFEAEIKKEETGRLTYVKVAFCTQERVFLYQKEPSMSLEGLMKLNIGEASVARQG